MKHSYNLKFEESVEEIFINYSATKDKHYIRIAFLLFSMLYALFSITDYILVPIWFSTFFMIRFFIVIPALILTMAFTYHPSYYKYKQLILTVDYILGGMGIVFMLLVEPLNVIYYGGLFLVFTSGYFMLHLNTKNTVIGGFSILVGFVLGILITRQMNLIIFSVSMFLFAENIIGALGAYQLEKFKRNEFLNNFNLNRSHENLSVTVNEKVEEIYKAQISTIYALAKLAESRDTETGEHIERVGNLCYRLASMLPMEYFDSEAHKTEFIKAIQLASALHDIGKVGIADAILNKPGPLNDEELKIMRTHTEIGSATLYKLQEQYPNNAFVSLGINITNSHHEKWDGSGYPNGLAGLEIPLSARIMAIVDVYDALISARPYKPAYTHEYALELILEDAGKHFDPDLVQYFIKLF